jgi:hypothetical protein
LGDTDAMTLVFVGIEAVLSVTLLREIKPFSGKV